MAKTIHRIFLGWDSPPLHAAVRVLHGLGTSDSPPGELDLSRTLIVVPGARAGRLLLGELVRTADEAGLLLSAPRLVTPGPLQDALLGLADLPRADATLRLALWTRALLNADPASLTSLIAHPPTDVARAAEFARVLIRAHTELAGHGLSFHDALDRIRGNSELPADEAERWARAVEIQEQACARLRELGVPDPEFSRLAALAGGGSRGQPTIDHVCLVGIVDLPALPRRLLQDHPARVSALIAAPESHSPRFDAFGCVSTAGWAASHAGTDLPESALVFCAHPTDGAEHAVAAALDASAGGLAVALTAADSSWITPMKRALERSAGPGGLFRIRSAAGLPIVHQPFFRLVSALAAHCLAPTPESLRVLLALPDASDALARRTHSDPDALALLDRALRREVVPELHDLARRAPEIALIAADLDRVAQAVLAEAPLHTIAARLLNESFLLAREIWDLRPRFWRDRVRAVGEALRSAIPTECPEEVLPARDALALLVGEWRGLSLPDEPDYAALEGPAPAEIEALGWLETVLDPAPCLVLAGMNEGRVPTPVPVHPLLPPAVRRTLGLPTDQDLIARDRALLAQMVAPRTRVVVLSARRDADDSPLWPSRLILDDAGPRLASRVRRFVEPREDRSVPMVLSRSLRAGTDDRFRIDPALPARSSASVVASMRVTDFRLYLESPLRFYLARVLKVEEVAPDVRELDALAFGTLVHDAVKGFSSGPERDSDRADRIARALEDEARRLAGERFGSSRSPAVRVQIEFAVQRLRELADWQARRRAAGWEIHRTEWSPSSPVSLIVDGTPMTITGRIDRIDRGPGGQIAILDYKSGNEVLPPARTHFSSEGWIDLQLPLYTVLARELLPGNSTPALGYIAVPRQRPADAEHLLLAEWDQSVIDSAIDAAHEVVRRVRAREFTEVGRPVRAEYAPITAAYLGERFLADAGAGEAAQADEGSGS